MCVGEFLNWLDQQGKPLEEVTLEDISGYFHALAQRKLKRTSIALHVAKLRNFFRYAESKHWCRAGLATLDAPRIYRLESLPRGPAWSDVQRLLAACAGNTPSEIRDHAMLVGHRRLRSARRRGATSSAIGRSTRLANPAQRPSSRKALRKANSAKSAPTRIVRFTIRRSGSQPPMPIGRPSRRSSVARKHWPRQRACAS